MSKVKFTHASGNSVSIAAPESNPASNRTLYVPSNADGTIRTTTTPGAILQVVSSTYTTSTNNTTTTYADTGLTGTISISANSHVLVMVTQPYVLYKTSGQAFGDIRLLRASTAIRESNGKQLGLIGEGSSARRLAGYYNVSFLDEGASTGSNTYKTQMKVNDSSDSPKILVQDDSSPATIILMEVAG